MDESSLDAHVAYSAGQPKTPRALTGAGTVVEILKVAGVLREEGGNLVAAPETSQSTEIVVQGVAVNAAANQVAVSPSYAILPSVSRSTSGVNLSIEVRIQCTPADLDGLGQKLRQVLKDFSQPDEPPPAPATPSTSETDTPSETYEQ
jgi:hypothetical protein